MSRILEQLQSQSQGLADRRDDLQQRINNFDLEKEIYNGSATAYNLGKAQLQQSIGAERVQALEMASPLLIKGIKAVGRKTGVTDAIADKYKAFRGGKISQTVEDLKSRGQSAIDEAGENLGGQLEDRFSLESLTGAADKLANTSAEDIAAGVLYESFDSKITSFMTVFNFI